jgi:hypothetical protein
MPVTGMRKSTAHVADGTEGSKVKPPTRKPLCCGAAALQQLPESDEGEQESDSQADSTALHSASAAPASCSTVPEGCGRGMRKRMKNYDIYASRERVGDACSALWFIIVLALRRDGKWRVRWFAKEQEALKRDRTSTM